jgi:hypothetical protein
MNMSLTRREKVFLMIPLAMIGMMVFAFLGGEIVRLLWNWLTPPLFGFRAITFWQALGLLALCRILFGGFGFPGGSRRRMGERWGHMNPEERERFRQGMRERFGFGPTPTETEGQ